LTVFQRTTFPIICAAVTRTSTVAPTLTTNRFSEALLLVTLSVLTLSGQPLPEHSTCTMAPGVMPLSTSCLNVVLVLVPTPLAVIEAATRENGATTPSQFSATALPGTSTAPGCTAAARSLQSSASG